MMISSLIWKNVSTYRWTPYPVYWHPSLPFVSNNIRLYSVCGSFWLVALFAGICFYCNFLIGSGKSIILKWLRKMINHLQAHCNRMMSTNDLSYRFRLSSHSTSSFTEHAKNWERQMGRIVPFWWTRCYYTCIRAR